MGNRLDARLDVERNSQGKMVTSPGPDPQTPESGEACAALTIFQRVYVHSILGACS